MRRKNSIIIAIAIVQAAGLAIFAGFQFFSAGIRDVEKDLILLSAIWVAALVSFLVFYRLPIIRRKFENIEAKYLLLAALAAFTAAAIFLPVSPIPRAKDPSNWQTIEIQPVPGSEASRSTSQILLMEIKIDGRPLQLEEWQNVSGWSLTDLGLISDPGSSLPLLIQSRGPVESGVALLLGKGPQNGEAEIRLGWQSRVVDTYNPGGESQIELAFPPVSWESWAILSAFGLVFTVWAVLMAAVFLFMPVERIEKLASLLERMAGSVTFWVTAGFFVSYMAFFFQPVFLNSSNIMQLDNNLPSIYPIGNDLNLILKSAKHLVAGESPYAGSNKYPPLAAAAFTSLLGLGVREAFKALSTLNLFVFVFLSLGVPYWLSSKKKLPNLAWLLTAAGLFSYGFLFEIERGQFNLIAMGAVFAAIILYHRAPRLKWPALILFCLGVQLKIYPAVFVVFFTRDWRDWKGNLMRWAGLGAANILLLMALGWQTFIDFVSMMTNVVTGLGVSDWPLNHSVSGFIGFLASQAALTPGLARFLQISLTGLVIGLLALILWSALKRREILDPYLIIACTLAALTLPSLSNDYTLALLVGPAILFFGRLQDFIDGEQNGSKYWPMLALAGLAFGSTFFSYFQKASLLQNQFPALLILLIVTAVFAAKSRAFIVTDTN